MLKVFIQTLDLNPPLMQLKLHITILLTLIAPYISAQDRYLSKTEMESDLIQFEDSLRILHIDLYRYTSKKEFTAFYDSIYTNLPDSLTLRAFYNQISQINSKIRCGHTRVKIDEWWSDQKVYIPFSLYSDAGKVFIYHDLTETNIQLENRELISINGVKIQNILTEIRKHMPSDGFIETGKRVFSEKLFPILFANYYDLDSNYTIEIYDENLKKETIVVPSSFLNRLLDISKERYPQSRENLTLRNDEKLNYSHLIVNSFYMDPSGFKLKIDSLFLKGLLNKNLIIDLRGNTGGKIENEYHLLSYLISTDIKAPFKRVYQNPKNKKFHYKTKKIYEKSQGYSGSIYFIMNGYTFSAAAEFLSIVQRYKLGKLVGEETGGALEGCNYGAKKITLSYSKITCSVPNHASYFNGPIKSKGRGVIPQYYAAPNQNTSIEGVDSSLQLVISLIQKNNNGI